MRVILIDPENQTIRELDIERGLKPMYAVIGNDCNMVEAPFSYENDDTLYCDEEGTFHNNIGGFMYKDWNYPIVGKGLIMGTDWETGDSVDAKSSIEGIKKGLIFLTKDDPRIARRFY